MKVEVINTGSELLLGQVVNTHVGYFGEQLFRLGLRIARQMAVPDGAVIGEVLGESFPRSEVLLVTGGLGPTSDDITREVMAEMLGLELEFEKSIMDEIEERFHRFGREPGENNRRQAMVPRGSIVMSNPNGTAPGLYFPAGLGKGSPHVFLLPGPPREMKPMFETEVLPVLRAILRTGGEPPQWRNYWFYGVGESALAEMLDLGLEGIEGLEVGYCLKDSGVIVRCIGGPAALAAADGPIRAAMPENLASDDGRSLEEVIVALLSEKGETVATAESCTGGFLANLFTNVPGASEVFGFGHVTYANAAKVALLGVPAALIESHGAVSAEVAAAMAEGCLRASGADHALSVTGIAGPGGGSEEKPVGTVHFGLASRGQPVRTLMHRIQSDRLTFKERAARLSLDLLRRRLRGFL